MQNVVQQIFIEIRLLLHLLDPGKVFEPTDARGDGDDELRGEDLCRNAFVFNLSRFLHGFIGQSGRSQELYWESVYQQVFALNAPARSLQFRVNGWKSR